MSQGAGVLGVPGTSLQIRVAASTSTVPGTVIMMPGTVVREYKYQYWRPYLSVDTNATQYTKTKKIERCAVVSTEWFFLFMWVSLAPLCSHCVLNKTFKTPNKVL